MGSSSQNRKVGYRRCQNKESGELRSPGRPWLWMLKYSGVLALIWLLIRTGTRPTRFAYPCQQAAFGTAAAALGTPLLVAFGLVRDRSRAILRMVPAKILVAAFGALSMAVLVLPSVSRRGDIEILPPQQNYHPDIYLVNEARGVVHDRHGGVDDLVTLMGRNGLKWHQSDFSAETSGPGGIIDRNSVVVIKINAQWSQRGGTNTDVLRGVIRQITDHPDGFVGEIIVADNGQGSGNLQRTENNAERHDQSPQDVVDDFAAEGWDVSAMLWDSIMRTPVSEYSAGDMTSGYVVSAGADPQSGIRVSYPKFRSASGSCVSYKFGVWSTMSQAYDRDGLVVINLPVLKTHSTYAVTASVKNHMGVVTRWLGTDSHNSVAYGGMGTILAEVRRPDITILDCIWILARPGSGPQASYSSASRRDQLVAGVDPVALDAWAAKHILVPQILDNGYTYEDYHATQDPDNPSSVFRWYLDRSMNELLQAGIATTNDYEAVNLQVWPSPHTRPTANLTFVQYVNGELNGLRCRTRIILRNNASQTDEGEIRFQDAAGNPSALSMQRLSTHTVAYSLLPWGTLDMTTDGAGDLQTGVIEVVSDRGEGSGIEGAEVIEIESHSVSISDSPARTSQQVYVSVNGDENTGVGIYNPDSEIPVTVDLTLLDNEGGERAQKRISLNPRQQLVQFVDGPELFGAFFASNSTAFNGTLNMSVVGGGEIAVLGLLQQKATGALVAVSPSPHAFQPVP